MAQSQSHSVRASSFSLNVQACRSAMFLLRAWVARHKDKSPRSRRMGILDSCSDSNVSVHSNGNYQLERRKPNQKTTHGSFLAGSCLPPHAFSAAESLTPER